MPAEGAGERFSCTATKASKHGAPVVELNHPGIAAKSLQAIPAAPSLANAEAAKVIAIGEEFVIMMDGLHSFASSLLPAESKAGDKLYIKASDNKLAKNLTAKQQEEEGTVPFGVLDLIDTTAGLAWANFELRGVC